MGANLRWIMGLAVVIGLTSLAQTPVKAGPISDMIARHRAQRTMKLPPMAEPFSSRPVKDISPSPLSDRFKKRFSLRRPTGSGGLFSSDRDSGVMKTSR